MLSNCALYDSTIYPSADPARATRGFSNFCEASREIVSARALKFSRQPESSLDLIRLASYVIEFTGESGGEGGGERRPPCVENTFTEANHSYLYYSWYPPRIYIKYKIHVYLSREDRNRWSFSHTIFKWVQIENKSEINWPGSLVICTCIVYVPVSGQFWAFE